MELQVFSLARKYILVISVVVGLIVSLIHSQSLRAEGSRYSTYKPNYAIFASRSGDDEAVAVRLSGRYRYLDCENSSAEWFCNLSLIHISEPTRPY